MGLAKTAASQLDEFVRGRALAFGQSRDARVTTSCDNAPSFPAQLTVLTR